MNRALHFIAGILVAMMALILAGPIQSARHTSVVDVVKRASPAVVNISTRQVSRRERSPFRSHTADPSFDEFFRDFFDPRYGRRQVRHSLGSGVIIDSAGHMLTNEHVIISAGKINVTLMDGRRIEAELIGADAESDLAVLRLAGRGKMPFIPIGNSDNILVGEPSIAIGNPFGLGHTVTVGVISATHRTIHTPERLYYDFIQTDTSINPGNSGGPLLNADGELIGINSAIYQKARGIGFAIPINRAKSVVNDLIRYGEVHVGWLGVQVRDLTAMMARNLGYAGPGGVVISLIMEDGPAYDGGLKYGDVIEQIDGIPVQTKEKFKYAVRRLPVGKAVQLKVSRKKTRSLVRVRTQEFPLEMAEEVARYMLGIRVVRSPTGVPGVMVERVISGTPAERIGIRAGDIILKLNNDRIKDVREWRMAVAKIRIMDSALILVRRGRSVYYVNLPLSP